MHFSTCPSKAASSRVSTSPTQPGAVHLSYPSESGRFRASLEQVQVQIETYNSRTSPSQAGSVRRTDQSESNCTCATFVQPGVLSTSLTSPSRARSMRLSERSQSGRICVSLRSVRVMQAPCISLIRQSQARYIAQTSPSHAGYLLDQTECGRTFASLRPDRVARWAGSVHLSGRSEPC